MNVHPRARSNPSARPCAPTKNKTQGYDSIATRFEVYERA